MTREPHVIASDAIWPRDLAHRYRLYVALGDTLDVIAAAATPAGLGSAIVTLHEDEKEAGRRLADLGRIGVLDVMPGGKPSPVGDWVVLPYDRRFGGF